MPDKAKPAAAVAEVVAVTSTDPIAAEPATAAVQAPVAAEKPVKATAKAAKPAAPKAAKPAAPKADKPAAAKAEKAAAPKKAKAEATPKTSAEKTAKTTGKSAKTSAAAAKADKKEPVADKPKKEKKPKESVIRDSFSMPSNDYALLKTLKARSLNFGVAIKKSELVRAGLRVLDGMDDAALKAALAAIETIKTGRPAKQ